MVVMSVQSNFTVYLSGGMKSGWQDKVDRIKGVNYFDPRFDSPQNLTMSEFVAKDIEAVKNADLVFCYMESSNPTGYGAAWECAVALESQIPIITVWEKDYIDPFFACNSLYLFNSLDAGLYKLNRYINEKLGEL